nr:MAG TPA: DNA ligase [Caudoviricetes sp.]
MNEMINVFKIFNQLQSTSKKIEKIEILKVNKRNILSF